MQEDKEFKFIQAYAHTLPHIAALSHCKRAKVAAIIVKEERILCTGYNGTPSGRDNECEFWHQNEFHTKTEVIHAEANAIAHAAKEGIALSGSSMICTYAPCIECAKLIIQSGITKIYYRTEYRDLSGIKLLNDLNIKTIKL